MLEETERRVLLERAVGSSGSTPWRRQGEETGYRHVRGGLRPALGGMGRAVVGASLPLPQTSCPHFRSRLVKSVSNYSAQGSVSHFYVIKMEEGRMGYVGTTFISEITMTLSHKTQRQALGRALLGIKIASCPMQTARFLAVTERVTNVPLLGCCH